MLNCLQGLGYNSVILMNTNFVVISKACPMCNCGAETETTSHFFVCFKFFEDERQKLRDDVYQIDASTENVNEESLIDALLYGLERFHDSKNKQILLHTICYTQATKRFERPLIDQY